MFISPNVSNKPETLILTSGCQILTTIVCLSCNTSHPSLPSEAISCLTMLSYLDPNGKGQYYMEIN